MSEQTVEPLPTVGEELARKCVEQVERTLNALTAGQMSKNQARAAIETIYHMTAGLVEKSYRELLESAQAFVDSRPAEPCIKVFEGASDSVVVAADREGKMIHMARFQGLLMNHKSVVSKAGLKTGRSFDQEVEAVEKRLSDRGYMPKWML